MTAAPDDLGTSPDTILFIHGLWMTPRSWEKWAARYESRGYRVIAPSWPGLETEVEALNRDPSPIASLDLDQVLAHYEKIIDDLDRPPIIMGHSLGGTMTQVLLDRGYGSVGVGVASATVKGVRDLPWSTIKSSFSALNPLKKGQAVPLTEKEFHYAFGNTMTAEESAEIYQRYHVPAATQVLRDVAFSNLHRHPTASVDFRREGRTPLLFIAFEQDHVTPPKAIRHNEAKYDDMVSITEYKEFPGRPHFPGAPGWEEVADFALSWAVEHATLTVADHSAHD
jgi:pimeloyl-ACP methyl ester carboxylesterase